MSPKHTTNVMLVLSQVDKAEAWIKLALTLASPGGSVYVRGMIPVPADTSLSEGAVQARQLRDILDPLAQHYEAVQEDTHVYVDYQPMRRITEELQTQPVDLLLVQWVGPSELTGGVSTDDILQQVSCDVVLLTNEDWTIEGPVLLSLRGGPNISLGVALAKALCGESSITLFHAADQRRAAPDLEVVMRSEPKVTRTVTAITGLARGIAREAINHKALVLGAGFRRAESNSALSQPVVLAIREQLNLPLALVRARRPERLDFHAPLLLRGIEPDLSARVDRWFAENTYHSHEFSDLAGLMALKEKRGVTISVGLPALNEEETVETVIMTLKRALMDEMPLLDEIVLIDSNSEDNTVAIAESCGIPVYKHPDVLKEEAGSNRGKGEALWKSLHVLKGDIIAWVDTDITNIHPRFIYGLIGPLLKDPRLQYVKGFYNRPLHVGDKLQAYGGGRVTELVARPMINLFFPELSGIVQPLSGEYAGRRDALAHIPFFSGYGVETGMLIDLLQLFGLDAIAQSDLEVRVHHNQPLVNLSKMSFAILQVFISRLEQRYGVELVDLANKSMKLIIQEPERFALEVAEIGDVERPPMVSLPAYQAQHQVPAVAS